MLLKEEKFEYESGIFLYLLIFYPYYMFQTYTFHLSCHLVNRERLIFD